jgi:hypothetical protein
MGQGPPGGPPDAEPPELVKVTPDSGAVGVKPRNVVFEFDETMSEVPAKGPSLADMFVISPRVGGVRAGWHRSRVTVHGTKDWRPNTAYTITMLPGMRDLRNNEMMSARSIVFSTGPTIPRTSITGDVVDWTLGAFAPEAFVEAIHLPDSTTYLGVADSAGNFTIRHVAQGTYIVRAILDVNRNRALDPREQWDSVRLVVGDANATAHLFAFAHDSVGPGLRSVTIEDSVTLRITLDPPGDPTQTLTAANFAVATEKDSVPVAIGQVYLASVFDSLVNARRQDSLARADTTRKRDTVSKPPPLREPGKLPLGPRPIGRRLLLSQVVVRLSAPLQPNVNYRIWMKDVRGVLGASRVSTLVKKLTPPQTPR